MDANEDLNKGVLERDIEKLIMWDLDKEITVKKVP